MKKIISCILIISLLVTYASSLDFFTEAGIGSYIRKNAIDLADGTKLNINTLQHVTAGQTEERYLEYTPGSQVKPVVAYGSVLYGKSSIAYVANYVKERGKNVVAGINGDFFFVDTGIPVGIVVTDGILRSSDSGQYAVGFFPDGSAIIAKPELTVRLVTDTGYTLKVDYVNKQRKNYGVYLLTPDYSANTRTSDEGTTIILTNVSGDLRIGGTVTATVSQVVKGSAPLPLTPGTMALTATEENGLAALLDGVAGSNQVTISITSTDPAWSDVIYAVGAGQLLVSNGNVVSGLPAGSAPRTSVGITPEGKVVFYTVDGRQSGYSNGMDLTTLAKRMQSLGCDIAVNLDGGGSTAMIARYPGYDATETINRPSDGSLRLGANYILLVNEAVPNGTAKNLHLYPIDPIVLAGSTISFSVKATDSGYYPVNAPAGIHFAVSHLSSSIDAEGRFTAGNQSGKVTVYASASGMQCGTEVTIVDTPTSISIYNNATGKAIQSLDIEPSGSVDLNASSSLYGVNVVSSDDAYKWEIVNDAGDIGTIDKNGVFVSSMLAGSRGKIRVTAGQRVVEIPVVVGAADQILDTFENQSNTGLTVGNVNISASINRDKEFVRFGDASGMIAYDFTGVEQDALSLPARWSIPINSKYLHLWLYGDGSGNAFGLEALSKSGKSSYIAVCRMDFRGYRHFAVSLPSDAAEISALYIRKESETGFGTIYIDQMVSSYYAEPDTMLPEIEMLSVDTTSSPGKLMLRARITDGSLPVPKNRISLTLDGSPAAFSYSEASAELSATIAIANNDMIHRITIKAVDAFGNISTVSLDYEPSGAIKSVFADTKGHWSEKYAAYLYNQGVINGVVRNDGVYFYPTDLMTRAQFAVMLTNYLGLDKIDYSHVKLPYADLDKIPNWARNAVAAMYENRVFLGKNVGGSLIFDPDAPITRAQVMTAIGRTLPKGMGAAQIDFYDRGEIPDYAAEFVGILVKAKVLTGYTDGTIRPNLNVQRSEAVKMLYGLF